MKPTPRPWILESEAHDGDETIVWHEPTGAVIANAYAYPPSKSNLSPEYEEAVANAALIVEAVNAYDTLRTRVAQLEAERDALRAALSDISNRSRVTPGYTSVGALAIQLGGIGTTARRALNGAR